MSLFCIVEEQIHFVFNYIKGDVEGERVDAASKSASKFDRSKSLFCGLVVSVSEDLSSFKNFAALKWRLIS